MKSKEKKRWAAGAVVIGCLAAIITSYYCFAPITLSVLAGGEKGENLEATDAVIFISTNKGLEKVELSDSDLVEALSNCFCEIYVQPNRKVDRIEYDVKYEVILYCRKTGAHINYRGIHFTGDGHVYDSDWNEYSIPQEDEDIIYALLGQLG